MFRYTLRALAVVILSVAVISPQVMAESETWVLVDKTRMTLGVYKGDQLLREFNVALGADPHFTPEGTFRVVHRIEDPAWKHIPGGHPDNPLGKFWIGLDVVSESGERYGIHGTNMPDLIGQNASDGCIRMHNSDVAFLIQHVPVGSKVVIVNDSRNGYVTDRNVKNSYTWVKIWGKVAHVRPLLQTATSRL